MCIRDRVIIGAITDTSLEGKIRVSIVATSLDGQQPESKSVINMVHRIQSRNTGYSDFTNTSPAQSFNFNSSKVQSSAINGANALKLEEPITDNISNSDDFIASESENNSEVAAQEISTGDELKNDQSISENETTNENSPSNGLENFGLDEDSPNLFNTDNQEENSLKDEDSTSEFTSFANNDENNDEDELEIPAFLRRQQN